MRSNPKKIFVEFLSQRTKNIYVILNLENPRAIMYILAKSPWNKPKEDLMGRLFYTTNKWIINILL